jgi:hypothetical protein
MRTGALLLFVVLGCSTLEGSAAEPEFGIPEYDRKEWKHWADLDKDCQDARQEVLIRDSKVPVTFKTERQCKVALGEWHDIYSSTIITNPTYVDIDHVVALGDAHESGGYNWSADEKKAFANDLGQLVSSSRSTNRSKGAKGPDEWLPPLEDFRCEYLEMWLEVKKRYGLEMSCSEEATINQMKRTCLAGQVPVQPQN